MSIMTQNSRSFLHILPRAMLILTMLTAPVLAVPVLRADTGQTIEAPALKKKGIGFVLLVSLQRS
ncbi:hypothetical protein ACFPLB_05285 [Aquamicrobium segne]|uniref:Uncharacterized protein n=1 Tax=Aquamicrobium segne TaxID=469547 RepID=A0ABW0GWY1_9HYPH